MYVSGLVRSTDNVGADIQYMRTHENSESNMVPVTGNARACLCSDKRSPYEEFTIVNDVVSKEVLFTLLAKTSRVVGSP